MKTSVWVYSVLVVMTNVSVNCRMWLTVSQPGNIGLHQQQQQQQQGFGLATSGFNQQTSSSIFPLPVCLLINILTSLNAAQLQQSSEGVSNTTPCSRMFTVIYSGYLPPYIFDNISTCANGIFVKFCMSLGVVALTNICRNCNFLEFRFWGGRGWKKFWPPISPPP